MTVPAATGNSKWADQKPWASISRSSIRQWQWPTKPLQPTSQPLQLAAGLIRQLYLIRLLPAHKKSRCLIKLTLADTITYKPVMSTLSLYMPKPVILCLSCASQQNDLSGWTITSGYREWPRMHSHIPLIWLQCLYGQNKDLRSIHCSMVSVMDQSENCR